MKCDRFVGTGIVKTENQGKPRIIASPSRSTRHSEHGKSCINSPLSKETNLLDTVSDNAKNGNVQGSASHFNEAPKSTIPIVSKQNSRNALKTTENLKESNHSKKALEDDANRCILIRMEQRRNSSIEKDAVGWRKNNEDNITTCITDYEVRMNTWVNIFI